MTDIARLGFDIDSTPARTAAKDLDRLAAAADKTERSARKLSTASRDLLRDESGKFMSAAKAAETYGTEIEALRMKYNPLYAASKQFEAQQGELQRALALGAISVAQYDAALEGLQSGMVRSGVGLQQFGTNMQASTHHATNLSYQLNDIGMMMSMGQSPFMLMMQQGPQVSQIFSTMAAEGKKIGPTLLSAFTSLVNPTTAITLAIIGGSAALVQWGMSAFGASEEARTLDDALSQLDEVTSGLKSTQDILEMSVSQLIEKYGSYGLIVKQVAQDLAQNQLAEMNNALTQSILESASAFDQFAGRAATAFSSGVTFSTAVGNISRELGVTNAEAYSLAQGFDDLRNAMTVEDRVAAFRRVQDALRDAGVSATKLPPELNKAMTEAGVLAIKMAEAKGQAEALADAAPGSGWMDAAISGVSALGAAIRDRISEANRLRGLANAPGMTTGSAEWAKNGLGFTLPGDELLNLPSGDGSGSSGAGSGGGTDPYADNLTRLIESMRTEREVVDAWYNENLTILNDRRALEILGEQAHKDALLDLEREYQEKLGGIKEQGNQWGLQAALDGGAEIFGAMGAMNQKFLKAQAVFAAGSALISTYQGAAKELEKGTFGFATAAAVIAKGIGFVAAIKSAGSGASGGGSGSASATTSATTATQSEPDRVTRVELMGEDWLVSLAETMMTQIYDASKNGRVIVARA